MPIISTRLRGDYRPKEGFGLVIVEFVHDDGTIDMTPFEAHSSEDVQKRISEMIPQRNADKAALDKEKADAEVLRSGTEKVETYVKALPDKTLTDAGLTQEEVEAIKGNSS